MAAQEQPVEEKKGVLCCLCGMKMQDDTQGIMDRAGKLRVCVPCVGSASRAVKDPRIGGVKVIDFSLYRMLDQACGG